ncbi:methyltransferase [Streptomyces tsukubensis]|uniref:Uncharacterized protein n=1 Tax=Streptomyces tsukubensis TaxID=83656 RepID=A0A1V3ZZ38_9ACTN|nr:methyltransferase [Streptomyces tsukubensis]OON71708.1 hypothetical protein B1H18_32845 [Streptomyces tsukubensis]QFR96069.1 hypothetical protein GBW32_27250 [Streptomyces tsukubensis]
MELNQLHEREIAKLAVGGWFSRALAVTARLGIADVLKDGALSHTEIAERTDSDPDVLLRLMRVLVFCGVAERDENGEFAITEKFAQLRTDHPWSMRHVCMLFAETYDDAFGGLLHTVKTGESGFQEVFGVSLYEHLERDAESARVFDQAMVDLARPVVSALLERHDFSEVGKVVDVGGGGGGMALGIVAAHPHLRAVCADRESVCKRASAALAGGGHEDITDRLSWEPTDFFVDVPAGGDRYILKNVLHDWSFESCLRILTTVSRAMTRTSEQRAESVPEPRLLVLEPLVAQDFDAGRELFQMVACEEGMSGLKDSDMRALLDTVGFEILSVDTLPSGHTVFECRMPGN